MPSEAEYTGVRLDELVRNGRRFAIAEPPITQGRLHRRVIGGPPNGGDAAQRAIDGKPLIYFDTYLTNDKTYIYARHRATANEFLSRLDSLILEHTELREERFLTYITVKNETYRISLAVPLTTLLTDDPEDSIRFFKISLPFGEMSIQFGGVRATEDNQWIACKQKRTLTKAVESPILGFQAGEENRRLFVPLFTGLHWASRYIPGDILEFLINEVSPAVAAR